MDAHCVYYTLAEILHTEKNLAFASLMVQVLNMILFTSMELYDLRMQLKDLETPVRQSCRLPNLLEILLQFVTVSMGLEPLCMVAV